MASDGQDAEHLIERKTNRLRLVALDAHLARLQIEDRSAFFAALGAQSEALWPPVAQDAPKLAEQLESLNAEPEEAGWRGWVFLMSWTPGGPDRAVGSGGFFGLPDDDGAIEIGYAMLPSFREQGLATEAVGGLVDWAFEHEAVTHVRANTLAHLDASRRVLEKSGFVQVEETEDKNGDVSVLYTLSREARVQPA